VKRVDELLHQPEFLNAHSEAPRIPQFLIQRDGKFIKVLGQADGKLKVVQFTDSEGKKTMPGFFKGFASFADGVRHRKLPKPSGKVTPNCHITME
jgi:hypothetical protein